MEIRSLSIKETLHTTMKFLLKITGLFFLSVATMATGAYFFWYKTKFNAHGKNISFGNTVAHSNEALNIRLKKRAAIMRSYAHTENYDSSICFFVDMNISSGKNRFFVYDLKKDSIVKAGLVTHGSGSAKGENGLCFSNESGSNCTSIGKYKIGKSYMGKFGLAFKLYGLEKSNSNALDRFVVLHAHACVPDLEVYPLSICESQGCPTVSPAFLQCLKKYIEVSEKPVLLSIYK